MVIKDSHVKLFMIYPEQLQTLLLKNCVLLSKMNWATDDFASLKRFYMQDCVVNYLSLLYKGFSRNLEEYTLLDSEPRTQIFYDPLDCFSRYPMAKRFTHVKIARLRGKIMTVTVVDFLKHLVKGQIPLLKYILIQTVLPPEKYQQAEIVKFCSQTGSGEIFKV